MAVTPYGQIAVGAFGADGGYGEVYWFTSIATGSGLTTLNSLYSSLTFTDTNLEACVQDHAAVNGWATVDEVSSLDCSDRNISDVTGLSALDALQTLDLSLNNAILCADLDALEAALPQTAITRPSPCNTGGGVITDVSVQNLHNAAGQRVVKTVNGDPSTAVHFLYDRQGRVIAEMDAVTGATLREYIYINGQQVALVDDTGTPEEAVYFVHNDHLGTPQRITEDSQDIVWAADYEPFGKAEVTVAAIENNVRFPGQYTDEESGLHYNYHRDYDPSLGRYVESDPIGLGGGLNTYLYADGNPLINLDMNGLASCDGWWWRVNFVPDPIGLGPLRGCTCNWICRICEGVEILPMLNDPYVITAFRTRGTMFSDRTGKGLEDGNECSCAKPGPETGCDEC